MRAAPGWVRWARASLLVAMAGHGVANAFLDEEQFSEAGLAYTWTASIPLLIQAVVVLALVVGLGPLARFATRLGSERRLPRHPLVAFAAFASAQVVLFLVLELTERLGQREPFTEGIFASGFSAELVLALVAALVLTALATLATKVVRALRRAPSIRRTAPVRRPSLRTAPHRPAFRHSCGERAPPAATAFAGTGA